MRKPLVAALLASTLLAMPALAQTTPAPAPNQSSAPAGSMSQTGSSMNFLQMRQPDQFRASDLIGTSVVGNNNESIGEINDVIMDAKGQVAGVVIGVGGFLGIGEKDVAVPMNALRFEQSMQASTANRAPATTGTVTPPQAPATTTGTQTGTATTGTAAAAQDDDGVPDRILLSMTKEQLQAAPVFRDNPNQAANTDRSTNPPANTTAPATAPRQ
jgi:sporulation protein YlmC with PRC-barrel domain